MEVICLQDAAFYALVDEVVQRLKKEHGEEKPRWVDDAEAMKLLGVSSKTTLQTYRDQGKIRFSQPSKKIILYDRLSIDEFLEKNAHETF